MFCLSHRVSLVLAVEGIPVKWESLRIPRPSGSCPFCRAMQEGKEAFEKALNKWTVAARMDPKIISDNAKDSEDSSDKDNGMDYKVQQKNKEKLREENNRKLVSELTRKSIPGNNRRKPPAKKPNHLRLV